MKWSSLKGADGVWGGDLVDTDTPFAGRDKVVHFVLGGYAQLLYERWITPDIWWNALFVFLLAVLCELVEQHRKNAGKQGLLVDEADGTDVVVTVAGGVLTRLIL